MDNKINYQLQLDEIITSLDGKKPSLLLHACSRRAVAIVLNILRIFLRLRCIFIIPIYLAQKSGKSVLTNSRGLLKI